MTEKKRILNYTAIVFLLLGSIYFVIAIFDAIKVIKAEDWPVTNGKITVCSVESATDSRGETIYFLKVRYDYAINGTIYTGGRISFTDYFSDSMKGDEAQETGSSIIGFITGTNPGTFGDYDRDIPEFLSKKYPVGKTFDVYYDPEDHSESYLEKGGIGGRPLLRCIILFFLAGATIIIRFVIREAKKQ